MPARKKSRRGINLKILNALRKAAKQNGDALPESGYRGGDDAVPATSTLDYQRNNDMTLDKSSLASVGQDETSKKVNKDQQEGRKLRRAHETNQIKITRTELKRLRRIEALRERRECELPSERRRRLMTEKFRKALARAAETAEQRKERLQRNAEASARARASETKEKREERLRRQAERAADRRRELQEQLLLQQQLSEGAETKMAESETESTVVMPQKCTFCEVLLEGNDSMRKHIKIHTHKKPHKCPLCLASFSIVSSLKTHILTVHTGDKSHRCPHCVASFSVSGSLKAHILTAHTGNPHESIQRNVEEKLIGISTSRNGSSFELGSYQIKEEVMDIEVVEHGLDQISY